MGFYFDKDISALTLDAKSKRKVLAHGKELMACHLYFEAGGIGTPHKHPHTQIAVIISGRFEFTLDAVAFGRANNTIIFVFNLV